mgnify:CR=1 FL=1
MNEKIALQALKEVNFKSATLIGSVWQNSQYDVCSLHEEKRQRVINELERMKASEDVDSPLGLVFVGARGTGKTHLLSAVRKYAFDQNVGFVLADMTSVVTSFWDTLLKGYLNSLRQPETDGVLQFKRVIEYLVRLTGSPTTIEQLSEEPADKLNQEIRAILSALVKIDRQRAINFRDIIRAIFLINSNHLEILESGENWLQGIDIDDNEKSTFGFSRTSMNSMDSMSAVEGISWLMSLRGPSVLALDQLDSIVAQYLSIADVKEDDNTLSAEQNSAIAAAKLIVERIGNGLMALRDKTINTLVVVSCIEATWVVLRSQASYAVRDRFHEHLVLGAVNKKNVAEEIVGKRLNEVYQRYNLSLPYPTWPFSPNLFESAIGFFPREILRRCHKHREECLEQKNITVLNSFVEVKDPEPDIVEPQPDFQELDQAFATAKAQVKLVNVLEEDNEDRILGKCLQTACYCLIQENPTIKNVSSTLEEEFAGNKTYKPLHGRVSLFFEEKEAGHKVANEKYLCIRALQKSHHRAYQVRLNAAMTESGIDKTFEDSRRLILLRTRPFPGGEKIQELTRKFRDAGGLFEHPSEKELYVLAALHQLKTDDMYPFFDQWLQVRRPISQLPFIRDSVAWLFEGTTVQEQTSYIEVSDNELEQASQKTSRKQKHEAKALLGNLPIGKRLVGSQSKETLSIRIENLTKHTVILAGSGSGKTVLVRRIVEEAALQGIPSIVIDGANDLARMGDGWPTPPNSWQDEDRQKAQHYHQNTQVLVWTPGRTAANPLSLNPLPDFSAVSNDLDEFNQAIDMARDSLQGIVAPGKSKGAKIGQGILRNALEYFAQNGGGSLEDFAELLAELPIEAGGNISNAQKKAQEMADLLQAEISNSPLLRQSGTNLDPAVLFGLVDSNKTRISVLNFFGLTGLPQQQQFLNQLAMTLFTWIKKHPAPVNRPLRGLLVIDEAKDFVPSGSSTACKASIIRLAAQARKYGLGMIFATQAPKSIDHNIIANCSTQFYGRANSPTSIQVIQDQLSQQGGNGRDIPKLQRGQFYAVSENFKNPIKVLTPLCLSYHPSTPLDDIEVMQRALESRNAIHVEN